MFFPWSGSLAVRVRILLADGGTHMLAVEPDGSLPAPPQLFPLRRVFLRRRRR